MSRCTCASYYDDYHEADEFCPIHGDAVVWQTKEGTPLRLKDIDDRHLLNIIAYCERNWEAVANRMADLADLAASTMSGEMAVLSMEQAARGYMNARGPEHIYPSYEILLEEAYRRGYEAILGNL